MSDVPIYMYIYKYTDVLSENFQQVFNISINGCPG